MKSSIKLAILGIIIFCWCSKGNADRLYTWEDNKGVTHITQEPPPQKTKMIDTMDYTATPSQMNRTTGIRLSNEVEPKQPVPVKTQKKISEPSKPIGTTESVDVDKDVIYDSDRGRYTRKAIRQQRKEVREQRREERRENRRDGEHPVRKIRKGLSVGRK